MTTPIVKLVGISRTYGSDAPVNALRNVDPGVAAWSQRQVRIATARSVVTCDGA